MKSIPYLIVALAGLLAATPSARAQVLLTPGGTDVPVAPITAVAGTQIASLSIPFSYNISGAFETGTITQLIYRESDSTLTFAYSVANNASSPDALNRVTMTNFTGFTTSVAYVTGTGDSPIDATRQSSGDSVGFDFGGPLASFLNSPSTTIAPGTTSDVLVIATNATSYDAFGQVSIIDGATTTFFDYEPALVPEPATSALLIGGGVLLLVGVLRRPRAV